MKKFIDAIGSVALVAFVGGLVLANFYGPYHAFTKHGSGTGFASAFAPPYAWYMAAEGIFWHDDFADVDWDVRRKHDVRSIGVMLTVSLSEIKESNVEKFGQAVESLAKKIRNYPEEHVQYLKNFGRAYVSYSVSLMDDAKYFFQNSFTSYQAPKILLSEKTLQLEKELGKFEGAEELVESSKAEMSVLNKQIENAGSLQNLPSEKRELLIHTVTVRTDNSKRKIEGTYADIFGEAPAN